MTLGERAPELAFPFWHAVSLNVRNGGGVRVGAICGFLEQYKPDIIVLTEWRENVGARKFIEWAETQELHCARLNDGSTANGVLVAARMPFEINTLTPQGATSGVLMFVRFQSWVMLASYFPQLDAKSHFFSACAETARVYAKIPFLLIGDLNTGNQISDRNAAGTRYRCAEAFDALTSEIGLIDLWRYTNGAKAREWTWLSNRGNGFRIDHAFGNHLFVQSARPTCVYDHRTREKNLSDHSALVVAGNATFPTS